MGLSTIEQGGPVTFPEFAGERVYMRRFERGSPLPDDLSRWQRTVDEMLVGLESDGPAYIMIDQMFVPAGTHHRRPGLHVDWYWHEVLRAHGGGGHQPYPGHGRRPPRPSHGPLWPEEPPKPTPESKRQHKEAVVLAASTLGCRAYRGEFAGTPKDDGDAAHIDVLGLEAVDMQPGRAWICDAGATLHEALPEVRDCWRTVVRLNVAGWIP